MNFFKMPDSGESLVIKLLPGAYSHVHNRIHVNKATKGCPFCDADIPVKKVEIPSDHPVPIIIKED